MDIYAPLAGRMGMQDMREELEDLAFRTVNPEAYAHHHRRGSPSCASATQALIGDIEDELTERCSRKAGIEARSTAGEKRPYSIFRKMERKALSLRAALRHLRLPRDRRQRRRLLSRARRRPHHLAGRARAVQGLHLDAEAERLPLDPHHHRRPGAASASSCRSAPSEMHRIAEYGIAAHALYKDGAGTQAATAGDARYLAQRRDPTPMRWLRRTIEMLAEGDTPGGVPRAHQARAVPGPGLLLHAEGPADRAAARRHARSTSPMPSTPTSATPASAPRSTAASCR